MAKKISIRVTDPLNQYIKDILPMEKESLLETMARRQIMQPADCGGRGSCGKCRIRVIKGRMGITPQDKTIFSEEELRQGYRLACMAYPTENCTIQAGRVDTSDWTVVTESALNESTLNGYDLNGSALKGEDFQRVEKEAIPDRKALRKVISDREALPDVTLTGKDERLGIAIDLGTTTLAFALVALRTGKILRTHTAVNPQRLYGTDVISRIKASAEGRGKLLMVSIREALYKGSRILTDAAGRGFNFVEKIVISGNTTMLHLLMGYPCDSLGSYPYLPFKAGTIHTTFRELFGNGISVPVTLLPGISAFIGGDVTAGLLACGYDRAEKPCLLIDLGTNGEMAIGNRERILTASTAAGPAFEGGNISCGTGSIPGAISRVSIANGKPRFETMGSQPPIGICGTGVIELAAELLKAGLMDGTGLLAEPYFGRGYPVAGFFFTQKDIRELQLAKAAVRAGMETLIKLYGITYGELHKVYLAGGFGYRINLDKAVCIGLLPEELIGKTVPAGNTSLAGVILSLTEDAAPNRMDRILSAAEEIHLANEEGFEDLFIGSMNFSETAAF